MHQYDFYYIVPGLKTRHLSFTIHAYTAQEAIDSLTKIEWLTKTRRIVIHQHPLVLTDGMEIERPNFPIKWKVNKQRAVML